MREVTSLLGAMQAGDPAAAEQLLQLVYPELRQIAQRLMNDERPDHTLQPTILVHDAWMRLASSPEKNRDFVWADRNHFFRTAATAMRQTLIDHARRRKRQRRGAGAVHVNLDDLDLAARADDDTLLAVEEALQELAGRDEVKAALVELRFFLGMSIPEAAETLGVSAATAKRHWALTQAWLYGRLKPGGEGTRPS